MFNKTNSYSIMPMPFSSILPLGGVKHIMHDFIVESAAVYSEDLIPNTKCLTLNSTIYLFQHAICHDFPISY